MERRRALVTGAAGRVGRAVVADLVNVGFEVRPTDRPEQALSPDGVQIVPADLADPDAVRELAEGCEAIVHLAAYPSPIGRPGHEVFANNCLATYHVLAAAVDAGVERVAMASSCSAYGMPWAHRPFSPLYVPLDEDHPLLPQEAYGLSKQVDERTAEMFTRGHDLTVTALRFHWVATAEEIHARAKELASDPQDGRAAPELWGYIEIGDVARACRLALDAPAGFHALNICAADTLSDVPTAELIARQHPTTEVRSSLEDTTSPWSIARAREVLGFVPQWSRAHGQLDQEAAR